MTIKRAVFVTTRVAETWHQGTIGFARAVQYARPDLLLDTRKCKRYDFRSNLSRAGALKMEPGMRAVFEGGRLQAEPPTGYEGAWHVIVMLDNDVPVEGEMSSWRDAGWEVFRFDPCWADYPHPLRTSTPTEDRSNPVAVDNKIEGIRRQVAEMGARLKALEESEREAKPSYYEYLQRQNEGEAALQAVLAKEEMPTPPSDSQPKYFFRDVEYLKPSVLVKMALSDTTQGSNHVALRMSGIRLLGQGVTSQTLVLKDTDFLWTLDAIDTQTETVPHNPAEAWSLLIYTLVTEHIPYVIFGGSTEAVQDLLKLAEDLK